jgi:hypothetical protein
MTPKGPLVGVPWWSVALLLTMVPVTAWADGGGPVLIFAGPVVFLVGQVWILVAEVVVLRRLAKTIPWPDAWGDIVAANLRSYLLVGILLPVVVSVVGIALGAALGSLLEVAGLKALADIVAPTVMGFSGMVYDDATVAKVLPYGLVTWFVVTFFLSVRVEGRVLQRRWSARNLRPPVSPQRASWIINGVSYAGLTVGLAWIVYRGFAS